MPVPAKGKPPQVYWSCFACDEHGESDRAAEKHTKDTGHGTMTSVRPGRRPT